MSFRSKLILVFTLLLSFYVATFAAYNYVTTSRALEEELRRRGTDIVETFARMAQGYIFETDYASVLHNARLLIKKGEIKQVHVVDNQGKVWISTSAKATDSAGLDPFLISVARSRATGIREINEGCALEFATPVMNLGRVSHLVLLELSMDRLLERCRANTRKLISLACLMLLVSLLIAVLLSRIVSKPILELAKGTDAVIKGDLSYRINVNSKGEIGDLARSFNHMTARLKSESIMRQEKEVEIEYSRAIFKGVLDSIEANIYVADLETHEILFMNRYIQETSGRFEPGLLCYERFENKTEPCAGCSSPKLVNGLNKIGELVVWEEYNAVTGKWYLNYDKDMHWIDSRVVRLHVSSDITKMKTVEKDKKSFELRLAQAKRMEALGTMVGGVAHDLNNILPGFVSYPDLLLMDLPEDSPLRTPLITIKQSGEKAAKIVDDMLSLAGKGEVRFKPMDLNKVVSDCFEGHELKMILSAHPEVVVSQDLDASISLVNGSSDHLSKVVKNLVSNAFESIESQGSILIRTRMAKIDKSSNPMINSGRYVIFEAVDTGTGISDKDIEQVFEPFYANNIMGRRGNGLGMSVVWGMVMDLQGEITISGGQGRGTTVTVFLPEFGEGSLETGELFGETSILKANGETVVVVDDVSEQRLIATSILERGGYQSVSFSSGESAVKYLGENRADLVLLDMIMGPGMDGLDTYREIIKHNPGQKAIIVSGFSGTDRVKQARALGAGGYLGKPYSVKGLLSAVKETLQEPINN